MGTRDPDMSMLARLTVDPEDRRAGVRFPIGCEVEYRVTEKKSGKTSGSGRIINMSSSGVLFTAENPVAPGTRIQLWVSWPARLNQTCAMNLVLRGKVVRAEQGVVAVKIHQREFRTKGQHRLELLKAPPRTA